MIHAIGSAHARRLLFLIALLNPAVAAAQVLTTVEFSFSNPGARSMGFGGAFVALADDATAAFANPAGLVQLIRPEVSAEARSWSYSTPFTRGGRAAGRPTGLGIDIAAGPLAGESSSDVTGLSFLSFVYPRGRWRFAFFQHQLLNFEMSEEIQGIFTPGSVFAGTERGPIERAFFDLEVVTRGVAVAFQVSDKLSLGLGVSYFEPDAVITGRDYLPDEDTQESYFAVASFLPERRVHTVRGVMDRADWGLAAGFLWTVSERWQLGGVARQGPEFGIEGRLEAGPASRSSPPGSVDEFALSPWAFPDVYGLGVAYSSEGGRWTVGFEWDRVEYSALVDSLDPRLCCPDEVVDDGDELHLGAEYAFLDSRPLLAVRFGLWHDPDHRIRSESDLPILRAEGRPGADELHVAAGFGVAFPSFQLDLGIDLSERVDSASLSAIYSFR